MDEILKGFLVAHIGAGTVALLAGPLAMFTKKGGIPHRRWGKIYSIGMFIVFITAVVLALFKDIPFLLMIAFFSFYLVVTGYRALSYKKLHKGQQIAIGDWLFSGISLLFGMALVGWGVYELAIAGNTFGSVAIVLGLLACRLIYTTLKTFKNKTTDKNYWLYAHVTGMGGAYIATFTAFAVVNITFLPGPITWILPALTGGFLIARWKKNHKKGLAKKEQEKDLQLS